MLLPRAAPAVWSNYGTYGLEADSELQRKTYPFTGSPQLEPFIACLNFNSGYERRVILMKILTETYNIRMENNQL